METLPPEEPQWWFIFQNDHLLFLKQTSTVTLLTLTDLSLLSLPILRQHHIAIAHHTHYYCAEINRDTPLPENIQSIPLRKAFELLAQDQYQLLVKAYSVLHWDENHRFCGRCGHLTQHKPPSFERVCEACRLSVYPRISPCMIVLIHRGDEILMTRSPHFPPGAYGLVAGFVEAGESIEEAVHREVFEEVGLQVKNLTYFGSQPWPFPDSLMVGFTAEYAEGELAIDYHEIEAAGWYRYDQLPGRPSTSISIAAKLIEAFIATQTP